MMPMLRTLTIENYRSIKGDIVIPLNAPVVLIHGSNGMGKTSVLSALELGLTGEIAHLERNQSRYQEYLTNFAAESGSIQLAVEGLMPELGNSLGSVNFSSKAFKARPIFSSRMATFFSQRCYLPQAVLGRLLEMYDEHKKGGQSELTQFVKELLRIEPLDALVDGLDHALHVSRVRKLAPAYKQLEDLEKNYDGQAARLKDQVSAAASAVAARKELISDMLRKLLPEQVRTDTELEGNELRKRIANRSQDEEEHSLFSNRKADLSILAEQINLREASAADLDIASCERTQAERLSAFDDWTLESGAKLLQHFDRLRVHYPNLPQPDLEFDDIVTEAITWSGNEIGRLDSVLAQHDQSSASLNTANMIIERASTRIREINEDLATVGKDARTLANALAGIAPHVEGDFCPVCHRDYGEENKGPLTAHIASTIASLTREAGRLQALANERANEGERLTRAQRDLASAQSSILSTQSLLETRQKRSDLASIRSALASLRSDALLGTNLGRQLSEARRQLGVVRRAHRSAVNLLPEIDALVSLSTGKALSAFDTPAEALSYAIEEVSQHISNLESRLSLRLSLMNEFDQLDRELSVLRGRQSQEQDITRRAQAVRSTIKEIGGVRDTAKLVVHAATVVRTNIVRSVFSESLNKVWRDLFVRLAPAEQFVPQFRLPPTDSEKVEAVLETLHRSGRAAGTPGAMLSQGNLNTAALTLFLALHLSVPSQLPWLILDDPVQSMDDVHIAQFAALLRTLSKGLGKQIIVAVHERALFDYLSLELSPAFAGDSLIAVEINRSADGTTIADPVYFDYVQDKAVAA